MNKNKRKNKTSKKNITELSEKELRNRWIIVSVVLFLILIILILFLIFFFRGDVNIPGIPSFAETVIEKDVQSGSTEVEKDLDLYINKYHDYDYKELYQKQISKPKDGEEIVEIKLKGINKVLKFKLFEDKTPELVKQFKELIEKGYYNNQRIEIEPGKVAKTLIIDDSIQFNTNYGIISKLNKEQVQNIISWEKTDVETNEVLPYKGALCADFLISGDDKISANFFIMNIEPGKQNNINNLNLPRELREIFIKQGGDPRFISKYAGSENGVNHHANLLDYLKHPTFGHIIEGQDILDKITERKSTYNIEKIEITKYKE